MKELEKAYQESLKKIRAELAEVYAKYDLDEDAYAEMLKYNRLRNLEKDIVEELNELYVANGREMRQVFGEVVQESYMFTGFTFEKGLRTNLGFGLLPIEQIIASIQNPISGVKLNDRLIRNRQEIIYRTKQEITQSLIQGDGIRQMAKRVSDVYEGDIKKAERIVRTEVNRNRNAGTLMGYEYAEEIGVEFKRMWLATIDKRTRDTHGAMDGQFADENNLFYSPSGASAEAPGHFGVGSEDIRCRCTTIARLDGTQPRLRRVKGFGEVEFTTYTKWKEEKGVMN
jgi:SPP1 gp7 family putative phage head morphogenesis protein